MPRGLMPMVALVFFAIVCPDETRGGGRVVLGGVCAALAVHHHALGHRSRVAPSYTLRSMSFPRYEQAVELLDAHRGTVLGLVPEGAPVVDVHTHRPFDFDGFQISGSLRGDYSDLAGKATIPPTA